MFTDDLLAKLHKALTEHPDESRWRTWSGLRSSIDGPRGLRPSCSLTSKI